MTTTRNYSTAAIGAFVGVAVEKGWYNRTTGLAIKSACDRLFAILDDHESSDVRNLDLDDVLRRFANLNPTVNANTLRTYKSRAQVAVRDYLAKTEDPAGWKPGSHNRPKADSEKKKGGANGKRAPRAGRPKGQKADPPPPHRPTFSGLQYSFPLRTDWIVRIENVPMDLKTSEVERVAAFLRALANDSQGKDE